MCYLIDDSHNFCTRVVQYVNCLIRLQYKKKWQDKFYLELQIRVYYLKDNSQEYCTVDSAAPDDSRHQLQPGPAKKLHYKHPQVWQSEPHFDQGLRAATPPPLQNLMEISWPGLPQSGRFPSPKIWQLFCNIYIVLLVLTRKKITWQNPNGIKLANKSF